MRVKIQIVRRNAHSPTPNGLLGPRIFRQCGIPSPTHTPTEGRAPEWGSELTSKAATLKGGSAELMLRINESFVIWMRGACVAIGI
jgi:hypothetical protein